MRLFLKRNVLEVHNHIAAEIGRSFRYNQVFCVNILGSPGSGKTSLIRLTLEALADKYYIGVIEGDLATDIDTRRLRQYNIPVYQINTQGGCHLEAKLIKSALENFDLARLDILFIENIGNLVCPAAYRLGESRRLVCLSIPEGDDKPAKYPPIFQNADLLLITKCDLEDHCSFDFKKVERDAKAANSRLEILELSAKTGRGREAWINWLDKEMLTVRRNR
ncbi:MAG: hydrogenase nickel incorporation protein HypB [Bacillota bacterium]